MAAKIRGLGRLLLALALMGWGQFGFASEISYWRFLPYGSSQYTQGKYSSAKAACESYNPNPNATYRVGNQTSTQAWCYRTIYSTEGHVGYAHLVTETCQWGNTGNTCNTSCLAPGQMVGGQCITPEPEPDCSTHLDQMKFAAVDCAASSSGAYSTPSAVSIDGAEYVSAPQLGVNQRVKKNLDGSGTGICVARYQGTGKCQAPVEGTPGVPDGAYADATPEGNQPPCFNFGGSELCLSPDNAGCDVYKGNPWCYQTGDTCGEINGEFTCLPATSRQCTFVNGKMECIATGNPPGSSPPYVIPPRSSDHPYNGGNADGNDKNDPKAPGAGDDTNYVGGGGPPTDLSQTNDELRALGDKLDDSQSLLQDILDLLSGEGTDDSGDSDGSPADAEAEGASVGNAVGEALTAHMDAVDAERNEEIEGVLDQLPSQVERWFGSDLSAVGLDFVDTIIPQPVACTNYVVPLNLGKYVANLPLPVCTLMPYKSLLEWVIWCLTAIGAFRIGYSALRQDDAKAVRGGY
jgi:hypothetical protein